MTEPEGTGGTPVTPPPTTSPPGLTIDVGETDAPTPAEPVVRPGKRNPEFIFPPPNGLSREVVAVLEGECQVLDDLTTRIGRFVREGRAIDRNSLNRAGMAVQGIFAVLARVEEGKG